MVIILSGAYIKFHKFDNEKAENKYSCDICGLPIDELVESDVFDNGNASNTQIRFCRSCVRNLDNIFEG